MPASLKLTGEEEGGAPQLLRFRLLGPGEAEAEVGEAEAEAELCALSCHTTSCFL